MLRRWPIFVWVLLVSAIADHPALDDLPAPPSFSQQEVVPLALQYRLQALQSMEHAQASRSLGLRAIHGAEVDLDDGRHVVLLVENERGWTSLCRPRRWPPDQEGRPSRCRQSPSPPRPSRPG